MSIIEFPNASERRRALRQASAQDRKNMQTYLFRSYHLILESEEADLVQDVRLNVDRAQTKLTRLRRRLQSVQEQAAAQVQLLTEAETKLAAAIVAALLSTASDRN
jgi:hypothetical protein